MSNTLFKDGGSVKDNKYWYDTHAGLWGSFDGKISDKNKGLFMEVLEASRPISGIPDGKEVVTAYYEMLMKEPASKKQATLKDFYGVKHYFGTAFEPSSLVLDSGDKRHTANDIMLVLNKAIDYKSKGMTPNIKLEEVEAIKGALPKIVYEQIISDIKGAQKEEPSEKTGEERKAFIEKQLRLLEMISKTASDKSAKEFAEKKMKLLKLALKTIKFKRGGQVSAKKKKLNDIISKTITKN